MNSDDFNREENKMKYTNSNIGLKSKIKLSCEKQETNQTRKSHDNTYNQSKDTARNDSAWP